MESNAAVRLQFDYLALKKINVLDDVDQNFKVCLKRNLLSNLIIIKKMNLFVLKTIN